MTDKEKIRKEVQRLMGELIQEKKKGFGSDSDDTCILELQNVLTYIDSLQEEPVIGLDNGDMPIDRWKQAVEAASNQKNYRSSKGFTETRDDYFVDGVQWADEHPKEMPVSEDLEEEITKCYKSRIDLMMTRKQFGEIIHHFTEWQKAQEYTCYEEAFEDGAKWKIENLWKPSDGDDLPEIDREVVVLTQPYPLENLEYAVSFAHRPNPNGWDGKSVTTGKVEHYTPKTYDKGGWNIPDVKYWLDCSMPKMVED